jgi:hypothetical protein
LPAVATMIGSFEHFADLGDRARKLDGRIGSN